MPKKKSFIQGNPAELFISGAGEPEELDTAPQPQEPPTIRLPGTEPEKQTQPEPTPPPFFEIKRKPQELKTKRYNALLKPSNFERIRAAAEEAGLSVNEVLNQLIEAAFPERAAEREDSQE